MIAAIDAHHHLWNYDPVEYGWIGEPMSVLKRDFAPADLKLHMDAAAVIGAVSVQARQSLEETDMLLDHASRHSFIRGVVGWVPFCEATGVKAHLDRYAGNPWIKGYRHVVQDEPDDDFILRPDFNEGIRALLPYGTIYDILIFERHLRQTIRFVDQHPNQMFVLDHIAKPRIAANELSPWRENLIELARRENVACKISGMATEAHWRDWRATDLKPYFDVALEAFTPRRLMFGSDWPVLELAGNYAEWAAIVRQWIAALSTAEQQRILHDTAFELYRL